jgi:cholesterol transport system auxiliary component
VTQRSAVKATVVLSLALGIATLSAGCALMSKAEQMSPRYFSPAADRNRGGAQGSLDLSRLKLRIGQIDSAAHLEERIAYRLSDTELVYYQDRRWTEPPEEYLRRALSHELFERRGVGRVVGGAAPTLDVELVSFEQVRHGKPRARLALSFSLRDERRSLLERTIVVEEPLGPAAAKDEAEQLALALSNALTKAVAELADRTVEQLVEQQERARTSPEPRTD